MPLRRMGRPGLIGMAARTAVVAGTATAVAGGVQHHQQQKYQNQYEQEQYEQQQAAQQAQEAQAQQEAAAQQAAAQQAAAQQQAAPADDLMTRLQQLATLHTQGVLTDEEFSAAKAKLLT
ncbi:Short C-terminal domain-containing protein [Leifsonia sp. 98AMF]|uniref:SHOCT domain-containing protein n=2 Tax=unclassified Leifsonia TaxID=2663824 RepID=UPI000879C0A8|nr:MULTISPECIES: SHOCT domain-containing protein [unclassified Leifsonia]TDP98738.1 putative oligomerization/nucleic acid binding protein [Leifsonia sp. 115AMFTsu3.1]SDH67424.1 Short C-terminal domain-containing protein [Leifsonia sp. 197AMF]SDI72236.1 Short C-terminal domain-containing protein [Leifsonia sp. 466MF]SDK17052.1 Short C-terminal domain-containing protein [Leifsonia sp. 157MF]SDN75062.1 Short C-terminal domain-containing protein [Leifsonia sp. 509MF]